MVACATRAAQVQAGDTQRELQPRPGSRVLAFMGGPITKGEVGGQVLFLRELCFAGARGGGLLSGEALLVGPEGRGLLFGGALWWGRRVGVFFLVEVLCGGFWSVRMGLQGMQ